MKAAPFDYIRADSMAHALEKLNQHGGDAKLIAAMGLWTGLNQIVPFILYTAMAGGVVTLAVLVIHRLKVRNSDNVVHSAATVPYGVAIALGGAIAAWQAALTEAI